MALSRNPEKTRASLPFVHDVYQWRHREAPVEAIAAADVVVNLAGETVAGRWTAEKKQRINDSRVEGTRSLVAAMRQAQNAPAHLISASAVGYYGNRGDEELTEASRPGAGFLAGVTQDWEKEALAAAQDGVDVAVMRFGIVLGVEGGALKTILPLFRAGLGGPLGSGAQWWPWVHIGDVVSAIASALEGGWTGVYNVTAPYPVRQREFARALGMALRRPAFLPVPRFALRLVQGEFADEVLFSKRVLPQALLKLGFRFQHEDIAGALTDLLKREEARDNLPVQA
jgi:uncharacterized protein (TIGR01777 family)